MSRLRVACLPAVVVERGGRPVAGFRSVGERALLVYLGVEGDRPHQRAALAGLLWPDAPEPVARRNLTQTLLRLRAALGEAGAAPPVLLVTRQTLQWNPAAGGEVDVGVLLGHLEAAAAHPHPALAGCAACLRRLGRRRTSTAGHSWGSSPAPPASCSRSGRRSSGSGCSAGWPGPWRRWPRPTWRGANRGRRPGTPGGSWRWSRWRRGPTGA